MKKTINDLIMKRPASAYTHRWRDSTPIGTGISGAMIYGGISAEHIILNRNDLWYGAKDAVVPDVSHCLEKMRKLQKQKKYMEAQDVMYNALIESNYGTMLGDMRTLGCVKLVFSCPGVYSHYRRVIHMDTSETEITYQVEQSFYQRKYLASRKRDIFAVEINSEQDLSFVLNCQFFCNKEGGKEDIIRNNDEKKAKCRTEADCLVYSSENEGKYYGIVCRILSDGSVQTEKEQIRISKTKKTLILIKTFSEEEDRLQGETKALGVVLDCPASYEDIYEENLPLYQELYHAADINLYDGEQFHSNEELIMDAKDTQMSAELAEKLWRFGRYLFISGTHQKGLPFPLYGLWVGGYNCEFTHHVANENVQSIYWHTEVGGLSTLSSVLIDYYWRNLDKFRENARRLYGCRGIFIGTYTTPQNAAVAWYVPVILHFVGVAGWLAQHFYRYYQYTKDEKTFEEKILPFMLEAATFYEDYYYQDENGELTLYPAVSPENTPIEYYSDTRAHNMTVAKNPTVEIAILKELLTNLIQVSKNRPELSERAGLWETMIEIMPEYRINKDGAVAEWIPEDLGDDYAHRHVSHIYPVFPGTEMEEVDDEGLKHAFRKAVDLRGDGSFVGWSMPHMSAIYSRFGDAQKAFGCLNALSKTCLLENFFTPAYDFRDMGITGYDCGDEYRACIQFDVLMSSVNAIQEMLIFSMPGKVRILPACPEEFHAGSARLHFMDGIVEVNWNLEKQECHGVITAKRRTQFILELPFGTKKSMLSLDEGEQFVF